MGKFDLYVEKYYLFFTMQNCSFILAPQTISYQMLTWKKVPIQ